MMMYQPPSTLPNTLALRVQYLRQRRMLSVEYVADKAQVPVKMLEDIEAGIETFMAPAIRQRIARVLQVRPSQLREVEKSMLVEAPDGPVMRAKGKTLHEAILSDPDDAHFCPRCEAPLAVRVFERRDLRDKPLIVIKANCTKCLFRLTDD